MKVSKNQGNIDEAQTLLEGLDLGPAVTLILATKLNWWQTNHHTGQGGMSPYIVKVTNVLLPDMDAENKCELTHTLGHWASTRACLNILKIRCLAADRMNNVVVKAQNVNVEVTDDMLIRVKSMPAGTAKHALCM